MKTPEINSQSISSHHDNSARLWLMVLKNKSQYYEAALEFPVINSNLLTIGIGFCVCEQKRTSLCGDIWGRVTRYKSQQIMLLIIALSVSLVRNRQKWPEYTHTYIKGSPFHVSFASRNRFRTQFILKVDKLESISNQGAGIFGHCTTVCTERRYRNHYLSLLGGPLCEGGLSNIPSKWLSVLLYLGSTRVARPVFARLANLFKIYK